jgi:hypothetical protein
VKNAYIYIYVYIYSCGHSGQACFPDLLRFRSKVAKSLFELQVIGVPWMHGVIVMCFVLAPGPGIVVILVSSACLHSIPDEAVAIEFIPTVVATLEPRRGVAHY